jgi:hypothetical protein
MTAVEATKMDAPIQVRDAFVVHALLQRLGSKNTYNEVKEAVSSSPELCPKVGDGLIRRRFEVA